MASKKKYVVWVGRIPGIYNTWAECEKQIKGFSGADFKSCGPYDAEELFKSKKVKEVSKAKKTPKKSVKIDQTAISVDGACSGNPGPGAFQCVHVGTGENIFLDDNFEKTTNNIMEFLALVKGLQYLVDNDLNIAIYSDSISAIAWVRNKKCKTTLKEVAENYDSFEMIRRGEAWLNKGLHSKVKILKWDTKGWGEIPADFGNK